MQLTISLNSMIALFGAMLVLAAMPSGSVLMVVSRSADSGFVHGTLTALGIVVGDIVFILIAILGLSLLAESKSEAFVLVKYIGGAYLVWLGMRMLLAKPAKLQTKKGSAAAMSSSFFSGLLFTLADQKALLFYLGFFPAFIKLSSMTLTDIAVIISITLLAVGGVKVAYAFMADRATSLFTHRARRRLNIASGGLMLVIGLIVIIKA
ncbi:MAG: LysE family translocator [Gammaproteobacteria bacterium]|nr:LysE family translocator [Gammaproteobacteria bacterium]NNJ50984.1 LysE family translocator [Gammaproteobacteria bacterium]